MELSDLWRAEYEAGGRGPQRFDCFGFFRELCARRGASVPDAPTPATEIERETAILTGLDADWVRLPGPTPGCAVAIRNGRYVTHVGMVMDDGARFIHMTETMGVVVARVDHPRWAGRIQGYYKRVDHA